MKIPTEFNGYVSFFMYVKTGNFSSIEHENEDCWADRSDDYIRISDPVTINCALYDVRASQIASLEKQIEKERAESLYRINQMLGKVQELQALESK